ncbi:MAG TPA: helix-turn-helix domain-containing protein, partial [Verrucomicrobiae bacterium]
QPVARRQQAGQTAPLTLAEVEALFASGQLIVDGCRRNLRRAGSIVDFHRRPVLLSLALELAARWPAEVPRDHLITTAFQVRQINESHRARLRVELSRLRRAIRSLAQINATPRGFVLVPAKAAGAIALIPPVPDAAGALLALLAGGEAWTTSALACALGDSQRTVQRALQQLEAAGTVRAVGQGRTRRWLAPSPGGFATTLLLPGPPALG